MKKLTILTLIFGTIFLSGCGAQQKNVSAENKSLSDKKVAVSSGEKIKNKVKNSNLKTKTRTLSILRRKVSLGSMDKLKEDKCRKVF